MLEEEVYFIPVEKLSIQNISLTGTKSCLEISAVKQSMMVMPFITLTARIYSIWFINK